MQTASRRRTLVAGSALLTATLLSLTACGAGTTDSGSGSGSGSQVSGPQVRIAVGVDASFAPFFLADAEGLWAKHGVNVDLVQFAKGGEGVD
ncbi:ABC transporter substrate-binding protein, partial [Streptomyces sp. NPDC058320]